jgi:hypothetical protein
MAFLIALFNISLPLRNSEGTVTYVRSAPEWRQAIGSARD